MKAFLLMVGKGSYEQRLKQYLSPLKLRWGREPDSVDRSQEQESPTEVKPQRAEQSPDLVSVLLRQNKRLRLFNQVA